MSGGAREPIVVFGTGRMATLVRFYLTHDSPFEVVAFTVDADHREVDTLDLLPVVAFEEMEDRYPPDRFRMSVPTMNSQLNHLRAEKYREATARGYELISYVSSRAAT